MAGKQSLCRGLLPWPSSGCWAGKEPRGRGREQLGQSAEWRAQAVQRAAGSKSRSRSSSGVPAPSPLILLCSKICLHLQRSKGRGQGRGASESCWQAVGPERWCTQSCTGCPGRTEEAPAGAHLLLLLLPHPVWLATCNKQHGVVTCRAKRPHRGRRAEAAASAGCCPVLRLVKGWHVCVFAAPAGSFEATMSTLSPHSEPRQRLEAACSDSRSVHLYLRLICSDKGSKTCGAKRSWVGKEHGERYHREDGYIPKLTCAGQDLKTKPPACGAQAPPLSRTARQAACCRRLSARLEKPTSLVALRA